MAIMDAMFNFADQQNVTGTSATNSTNVYNAGSAKKVFAGAPGTHPLRVAVNVTVNSGTSPTFRAQLVGSAAAALTTPTILADTGTSAALVAASGPFVYELIPQNQATAFQYYGVIFTLGGTSPDMTLNAVGVLDHQTNNLK